MAVSFPRSFQIAKVFGVPVIFHWSFFGCLWVFFPIASFRLDVVAYYCVSFAFVIFIHELGHLLAAKYYRLKVIEIRIHGEGGECLNEIPKSSRSAFFCYAGGTIAQLILLLGAMVYHYFMEVPERSALHYVLQILILANIFIMILNLIPHKATKEYYSDGFYIWGLLRGKTLEELYTRASMEACITRHKPRLRQLIDPIHVWAKTENIKQINLEVFIYYLLNCSGNTQILSLLSAYNVIVEKILDLDQIKGQHALTEGKITTTSDEVQRIMSHGCSINQGGGGTPNELSYLTLFIALLREQRAADILKEHQLDWLKAAYYIGNGNPLPDLEIELSAYDNVSGDVWIKIDNDKFSTMELVVDVLKNCFELSHENAIEKMLEIHKEGHQWFGPYSSVTAINIYKNSVTAARRNDCPLCVSLHSEKQDL